MLVGLGQVGRNLTCSFAGLEFLSEELLGRLEGLAVFSFLLVADEVEVSIVLFLDSCSFECGAYLTNQQIGRTTVEHEVMNIHEQVGSTFGLHNLKAIEWCLLQVERTHELILVGRQRLITHLRDGHLDRQTVG